MIMKNSNKRKKIETGITRNSGLPRSYKYIRYDTV